MNGSGTFTKGGAGGYGGGGQGGGSSFVFLKDFRGKDRGYVMYGGGGGGGGYSGGRGGSSFRDCENVGPGDFGSQSSNHLEISYCRENSKGFSSGGSGGGGGSLIADSAAKKRKEKGFRLGNGYVKIDYIPS